MIRKMVLLVAFALVVAACGSDSTSDTSPPETLTTTSRADTTTTVPETTTTTEAPDDGFPVTIDAPNGPVTIEERPERVVSISPSSTEVLFAVGAGEQVVAVDELIPGLDESTNGGGGGVEDGDSVFLDHLPETTEVGEIRGTFIHHLGRTHRKGAVNNVAVAGDPADVGGAPVDVVILHVEDVLAGGVGAGEVAAAGVEDSLGFSGGTRSVEDEEGML